MTDPLAPHIPHPKASPRAARVARQWPPPRRGGGKKSGLPLAGGLCRAHAGGACPHLDPACGWIEHTPCTPSATQATSKAELNP